MNNNWVISTKHDEAELDGAILWGKIRKDNRYIQRDKECFWDVTIGVKTFEVSERAGDITNGVLHTGYVKATDIYGAIFEANKLFVAAVQIYCNKMSNALKNLKVPEHKSHTTKHMKHISNSTALHMLKSSR
jgi:hypothetical protein